jgi:hypothetical protein
MELLFQAIKLKFMMKTSIAVVVRIQSLKV